MRERHLLSRKYHTCTFGGSLNRGGNKRTKWREKSKCQLCEHSRNYIFVFMPRKTTLSVHPLANVHNIRVPGNGKACYLRGATTRVNSLTQGHRSGDLLCWADMPGEQELRQALNRLLNQPWIFHLQTSSHLCPKHFGKHGRKHQEAAHWAALKLTGGGCLSPAPQLHHCNRLTTSRVSLRCSSHRCQLASELLKHISGCDWDFVRKGHYRLHESTKQQQRRGQKRSN